MDPSQNSFLNVFFHTYNPLIYMYICTQTHILMDTNTQVLQDAQKPSKQLHFTMLTQLWTCYSEAHKYLVPRGVYRCIRSKQFREESVAWQSLDRKWKPREEEQASVDGEHRRLRLEKG